MKLIMMTNCSDDCTYSFDDPIPVEYEGKLELQIYILDLIESHKQKCIKEYGKEDGSKWYMNGSVMLFDKHEFGVSQLVNIEHNVYTLEEWFEKNKLSK